MKQPLALLSIMWIFWLSSDPWIWLFMAALSVSPLIITSVATAALWGSFYLARWIIKLARWIIKGFSTDSPHSEVK